MSASALEQQIHDWLRKHALFSIVDDVGLANLVHELAMSSHAMGETIVQEGTPGDAVYLVYAGTVRVLKESPLGKAVTLATLGAGDIFGEHAALSDEPRSASVRATEDCVLLRLPRAAFAALLETQPALRPHLEKLARFRAFGRFLQQATILGAVPARQLIALLDQFKDRTFQKGETIFREGEMGDALFIVKTGEAKVTKDDNGQEIVLAYLGAGDCFGERALVFKEPRYASVVATARTECASLSRDGFEKLLAAAPQVHEQLRRRLAQYQPAEELARRIGIPRPAPAQTLPPRRLVFESVTALPETPVAPRRRAWLRQARPFVAQEQETDCGVACLAMIARYHGVRLSLEALRYLAHVGTAGSSMLALKDAAEAVGFECRAVQTDSSHLADLTLPAIAHWKGYHFLVLYEAGADWVLVGDPAEGLVRKSRQAFKDDWTGSMILLSPTPRLGQLARAPSAWESGRQLLAGSMGWVSGLLVVSVIVAALLLAMPLLLGSLLDAALGNSAANDRAGPLIAWLLLAGLGLMAALIVRGLLLARLGSRQAAQLNWQALQRLLHWPFPYFQSRPVGDWLAHVDVGRWLASHNFQATMTALLNGLVVVSGMGLVLHFDPLACLLAVVLLPLSAMLALSAQRGMRARSRQLAKLSASIHSFLVETLQAFPTLWETQAEKTRLERYQELLRVQLDRQASASRRQGLHDMGAALVLCLAAAGTAWHVSAGVIMQEWSAGQGVTILGLMGLILITFAQLLGVVPEWVQLARGLRQTSEFLGTTPPVIKPPASARKNAFPRCRGFLRLADVTYQPHPESPAILAHLDLQIEPGRIAWIVGAPGAGKTTLVHLLQRRYRPSLGKIFLDGLDLHALDNQEWQAWTGFVPQEPILVAGTIRENIALEHPEADLEQVLTASRLAGAHDFILRLPRGYDHIVDSAAARLSAGQKQSLCLARALVNNPRLLVLDEATALLGVEMEQQVLRHLRALSGDRTIIICTQRPGLVEKADLLMLLQDGKIVAKGSPPDN